jgi:hypothetical protein
MAGLNAAFSVIFAFRGPEFQCWRTWPKAYTMLHECNQQDMSPIMLVNQAYVAKLSSHIDKTHPGNLDGPHLMVERSIQDTWSRRTVELVAVAIYSAYVCHLSVYVSGLCSNQYSS